eukprot:CAMPEP_0117697534 /NCGR_PEP_ID=MMETSP0804-20121206/29286_1 /TAXON_ID=1074897 /ORGANISM="Tetraselmis astigmatica, Strain CCMP880" /LENGTH=604 /DNA_ID=CAMNT_0005511803 /DNA_START=108 /DNA_END=1920 /DNA_ORIENTATION=+
MPKIVKGPAEYLKEADTDGNGGISLDEFNRLLKKILPKAFTQDRKKFNEFVEHEFTVADSDQDGVLNKDEFYLYYYAKLCFDLPPNVMLPDGGPSNPGEELYRIYMNYCSYGHSHWSDEMGSNLFLKLCKDVAHRQTMLNENDSKKLTKQAIDLIFAKVKATRVTKRELGGNKIDFHQFLEALVRMACHCAVGVSLIIDKIMKHGPPKAPPYGFLAGLDTSIGVSPLACGGIPESNETFMSLRASFSKAVPGRSWVTGQATDFLQWSPTVSSGKFVRDELIESGVWQPKQGILSSTEGCTSPVATFSPHRDLKRGDRVECVEWWMAHNMSREEIIPELKEIFMAYNQNQMPPTLHDMDSGTWIQLCTDAKLIGSNCQGEFRATDCRNIFNKIQGGRAKRQNSLPGQKPKQPAQRWRQEEGHADKRSTKATININQFMECLRAVAAARRTTMNSVCEKVLVAGAPAPVGGVPDRCVDDNEEEEEEDSVCSSVPSMAATHNMGGPLGGERSHRYGDNASSHYSSDFVGEEQAASTPGRRPGSRAASEMMQSITMAPGSERAESVVEGRSERAPSKPASETGGSVISESRTPTIKAESFGKEPGEKA